MKSPIPKPSSDELRAEFKKLWSQTLKKTFIDLVPAQNPYELKAPTVPKNKFACHDCGHVRWFEPTDDPTSSSGSCPNCGGKHWND